MNSWLRLHVTSVCNFTCPNCHVFAYNEPSENLKLMGESVFLKSVDLFTRFLASQQASSTIVSIYGGEPFINKKRILNCIGKIGETSNGIKLNWVINTNGSLLKKYDLDQLKENGVEIHLSLDGKEEIHNQSRKTLGGRDTFKQVMKALKIISESGIRTQLNSHLMPTNTDHLCDLIDIASEFNIPKIYLDLSYRPDGIGENEFFKYKEAYFYGIKKKVNIKGPWSGAFQHDFLNLDRKQNFERYFAVEVGVDGTYFYPQNMNTKGEKKTIDDFEKNCSFEINNLKNQLKNEYDEICKKCSLKSSCYGMAIEQVRYHLNQDANYATYCDFYQRWMSELNQEIKILKTDFFIITYSGGEITRDMDWIKSITKAYINLSKNLPSLSMAQGNQTLVHVASDWDEFLSLSGEMEIPSWARIFTTNGKLVCRDVNHISAQAFMHELTHVLLSKSLTRLPNWFEEGLCQFFALALIDTFGNFLGDRLTRKLDPEIVNQLFINDDSLPLINLSDKKLDHNPFYENALMIVARIFTRYFNSNLALFYSFVDSLKSGTLDGQILDYTNCDLAQIKKRL